MYYVKGKDRPARGVARSRLEHSAGGGTNLPAGRQAGKNAKILGNFLKL